MKLEKMIIKNYRCFGNEPQEINIDSLTAFIGNNSTGKTAALSALNCIFSAKNSDHILKREDFHISNDKTPETLEEQSLYIETIFRFEELDDNEGDSLSRYSIPFFFQSMVVDDEGGDPYLRIRLEATWKKSNNIEGSIESHIYYIISPLGLASPDEDKKEAKRVELDQIRVIYVPAVRNPSKQLRNASSSMMYQIMNSINWRESTKDNIEDSLLEINNVFMQEEGISIIEETIHDRWELYDNDKKYTNAQLQLSRGDFNSTIKRTEIMFTPTNSGREGTVEDLSDGLRSLFYISMVDSILNIEMEMRKDYEKSSNEKIFNTIPPVLTIVALEEPENHIAPHLIGKLISNLTSIADKSNAQTIITSQSPAVVKRVNPENLRYFRLDTVDNGDLGTKVRAITLPNEEKESEKYKYIKEAVKAYPELYFANLVILGEGDSEEVLIPAFWEAEHGPVDLSGISIVPLGGRHVNHFWRLLSDLHIPFITLLDLDRERHEGGWSRIKYVIKQLIKYSPDIKDELIQKGIFQLYEDGGKGINSWDDTDVKEMERYIEVLSDYHVYFSEPLDIDFLMLETFDKVYKQTLSGNEGPYVLREDNDKRYAVIQLENDSSLLESDNRLKNEYENRIRRSVSHTLKDKGKDGKTYTCEQKKLMIWYDYFFLNRGKPSTHIELLSRLSDKDLKDSIPEVFKEIFNDAEKLLGES